MDNRIRRRYAHIFRALGRAELQHNAPSPALGLEELFEPVEGRWLGFYSHDGLWLALERYGFLDEVRALGYEDVFLELDTAQDEQMFRLKSALPSSPEPLIELVARRTYLNMRDELSKHFNSGSIPVLNIEWLLLQSPLRDFDAGRPPLPGQRLPGLGLGRQVFELLRNICRRLELEALVTTPSYFHNAVLYGEEFCFVDPSYEGKFQALRRDLLQGPASANGLSLAQLSWALRWELIFEETKQGSTPFTWFHEPMFSTLSQGTGQMGRAGQFLQSAWYKKERAQMMERVRYVVAQRELSARLEEVGLAPFDLERLEQGLLKDDAANPTGD